MRGFLRVLKQYPVEISPCPFCGEKPFVYHEKDIVFWAQGWSIRCANLKCKVGVQIFGIRRFDDVVTLWNKRMK